MLTSHHRVRRGPRHRFSATDYSNADELLWKATVEVVPDDVQQRQVFEKLMPQLYVLRNKGCSFEQITKILTDAGFQLQTSTVRSYYNELLADRMELSQTRMNEQIALMSAVRKEIANAEKADVSGRIKALSEAETQRTLKRADALRSTSSENHPRVQTTSVSEPRPNPAPPRSSRTIDAQPPAPATPKAANRPSPESHEVRPGSAVRPQEHRQKALRELPSMRGTDPYPALPSPTGAGGQTRVQPLKPNVPTLKPRDNVAPEVYQPGTMEHPAIRGLMLTLDERLYGAALEYISLETGEVFSETADQKRFRITWRRPVPMTKTRTANSFTEMDNTLFSGR